MCLCVVAMPVVTDMSPLRVPMGWAKDVARALNGKIPVYQVC